MKMFKHLLSLALTLAAVTQLQANDIRSGLLSYYPFDSSRTNDSVSANHFTEVGAPTLVSGQRGTTAIQFNGSSQYLRLDHTTNNIDTGLPLYAAKTYSIAMWVKGAGQTNKYLFTNGGTNNNNQLLLLQTVASAALATTYGNDKLDVYLRNDGGGAPGTLLNHVISSNVVFDNNWHHIAWVDDNGTAKLYVDGILDAANFNYSRSGNFSFHRTALGNLVRAAVATGSFLNGAVDDLAMWERALTQAEVQDVMANGLSTLGGVAPAITGHPTNSTRAAGQSAVFTVKAGGARPFSYSWTRNGVIVPDATNSTYQIDNLTSSDSGTIVIATVSNTYGSTASDPATLTIDNSPKITSHPQGITLLQGATLTLSVTASGEAPLNYAWTKDGTSVGENANPLVISNAQPSHSGQYRVSVSNSSGSELSNPADVVVNPRDIPPATIAIDFNNRANNTTDLTQEGFLPFTLDGSGATTAPTTRFLYNSIDATVVGFDSSVDTRLRSAPTDNGSFTEGRLLRDFAFAATVGVNKGLDVRFAYLKTNQNYEITLWCFDSLNTGNRESDWYINDALAKQGYFFNGATAPTSNEQYRFTIIGKSTATGELLVQGRQSANSIGASVFLNAIRLVETEVGALPPTITSQPKSVSTYENAPVTFSVTAAGTFPFTYAWTKDGQPVGTNSSTLTIPSAQFTDAGNYRVTVSNVGGSAISDIATLAVATRPATPSAVRIDINNTGNETSTDLEDGFESFALNLVATAATTRTLASGIEMTLSAAGPILVQSRLRTSPSNQGDFTEEKLLRDFVYSGDTNTTQGINVQLSYLKPGQRYEVTVWSFDSGSGFAARVSDWTANGELVREGYSFVNTVLPTSNDQYRFTFTVAADAQGKILLQARKNRTAPGDINCFINAIQLVEPPLPLSITDVFLNSSVRLTIQSPNPALPHRIDEKSDLASATWTEVSGVSFGTPTGNVFHAQFPSPGANRFYRAVMIPPAPLFEDNFEGAEKAWTSGGTGTPAWEKGTPAQSQGPGAAHGGVNCWAVGLTSQYSPDSDLWLRSPAINLTTATNAKLEFWEFRSVDELFAGTYVHYTTVRVKDAASGDLIVELAKNAGKQTQWTKRSFTLPPEVLGKNVVLEFQLVSDSVPAQSDRHGWFIDDVAVQP